MSRKISSEKYITNLPHLVKKKPHWAQRDRTFLSHMDSMWDNPGENYYIWLMSAVFSLKLTSLRIIKSMLDRKQRCTNWKI